LLPLPQALRRQAASQSLPRKGLVLQLQLQPFCLLSLVRLLPS
jgi:hypothetical protein